MFDDVDPNADDGADELEEVDVCSALEVVGKVIAPCSTVVGVAS